MGSVAGGKPLELGCDSSGAPEYGRRGRCGGASTIPRSMYADMLRHYGVVAMRISVVGGGTAGRRKRNRQAYLELCLARPRFHTDPAAMLADDPVDRVETEPRSLTHDLSGEEGL